jgi:DNA-binding NarL/FixJ family response regulator
MNFCRVFIADDHQLIIDGIKLLLKPEENIEIVGEARDGKDLFEKLLAMHSKTDIIILDISMPGINGLEAAKKMKARYPDIKIIVFTMHVERSIIQEMLDAGIRGYVLKNTEKEELVLAIQQVAAGHTYISSTASLILKQPSENHLFQAKNAKEDLILTQREKEITRLIAQGLSNIEIGEQLFISHKTVETHRAHIMKKLGAKNSAGVIRYAFQHSLID